MNKIILFLVEGETDKTSLALTLSRQLKEVKFFVIKTDITSDYGTTTENVIDLIKQRVKFFLSENLQFDFSDIGSIIQITDTDGTFILDDKVIFDASCEKIFYSNETTLTNNVNETKDRNHRKSEILNKLFKTEYIEFKYKDKLIKTDYKIYYMSCNLEHVLHNLPNVSSKEEKEKLSKKFRKEAYENNNKLRDIVFTPTIDSPGDYKKSWAYIQKGENSLKRKSNFSKFFSEYIDK